jgi:uncharacterized membrane protein YhhN
MIKIKISTRDSYLLFIGVLLAFFFQVAYEELNELVTNQINSTWLLVQFAILVIVGVVLLWIILTQLKEES